MKKESLLYRIINLFRHEGRLDWFILAPFLIINTIVLANAILHHPKIGYDVGQHLNYIQILPDRLPTSKDTYEFFSPPLPYFLPSRFDIQCEQHASDIQVYNGINYSDACRFADGKFAQGLNVLLSIGATLLILVIAQQIQPGNRFFKISALSMLALLTVYYKTFSQVRGEPYVVFFVALSSALLIEIFKTTSLNFKLILATGISTGFLILSRQWGFFIFPAIFLSSIWILVQNRALGWLRLRQFILISLLSAVVGGWFYIHLYLDYGTFSAFNIKQPAYPTLEQALSFFRQTELQDLKLFQKPVRPAFDNQSFFAILYSDTWGDYWGYFSFIKPGSAPDNKGNGALIAPYLGQVNLFSVFPSILLVAGFVFGILQVFRFRKPVPTEETSPVFITLFAISTIVGYLWFVYRYFAENNLVIKATYIIQLFIALVFLFASIMEWIRKKSQLIYNVIMLILALTFIHNAPAMLTSYNALIHF